MDIKKIYGTYKQLVKKNPFTLILVREGGIVKLMPHAVCSYSSGGARTSFILCGVRQYWITLLYQKYYLDMFQKIGQLEYTPLIETIIDQFRTFHEFNGLRLIGAGRNGWVFLSEQTHVAVKFLNSDDESIKEEFDWHQRMYSCYQKLQSLLPSDLASIYRLFGICEPYSYYTYPMMTIITNNYPIYSNNSYTMEYIEPLKINRTLRQGQYHQLDVNESQVRANDINKVIQEINIVYNQDLLTSQFFEVMGMAFACAIFGLKCIPNDFQCMIGCQKGSVKIIWYDFERFTGIPEIRDQPDPKFAPNIVHNLLNGPNLGYLDHPDNFRSFMIIFVRVAKIYLQLNSQLNELFKAIWKPLSSHRNFREQYDIYDGLYHEIFPS